MFLSFSSALLDSEDVFSDSVTSHTAAPETSCDSLRNRVLSYQTNLLEQK